MTSVHRDPPQEEKEANQQNWSMGKKKGKVKREEDPFALIFIAEQAKKRPTLCY